MPQTAAVEVEGALRRDLAAVGPGPTLLRPMARSAPRRRAPEEMLGQVAHDLRGLITVVQGYAELLADDEEEVPPLQQGAYEKILRSCALMSDLVDNCLSLGARPARERRVCGVAALIDGAVDSQSLSARRKNIEVHVEVHPSLPQLYGDPTAVHRVIANLLSNALKFSMPGSSVEVQATRRSGCVAVTVRDHGPGLVPAQAPELFTAGRRGAALPTGGERSTGLGLSIVRQIVDELSGDIEVTGAPGRGASFTVTFPALDPRS